VPSIGAENINGLGRYDYGKERLVPWDFFDAMRRGKVRNGDVMLYKDGAHIGRKALFRDNYPYAECAVNEHVFALRPKLPFTSAFVYFWLNSPELTNRIKKLNSNAAQPGINQAGVNGLPLLKPPNEMVERYSRLVEPALALLFNLAKVNRNLGAQRDLLLPKLISGEIDISAHSASLQEAAE
jgi:type I restriction enzyme S subunit